MSRTRRNIKHANLWGRHPKTTAEIREAEGCRVDGIKVRPARTKRHLPNAWDDINVAAGYEISKEEFRKILDL